MSDRLTTNQSMANDAPLVSGDGRYAAYLQSDANLVLCYTTNGAADLSRPYWSCAANAVGNYVDGGRRLGAPYVASMQSDGNFVLYNGSNPGNPGPPYWATNTNRSQGQFTAIIQDDGNFVVYDGSGHPIWASHTEWVGRQVTSGDHLSTNQWIVNDAALVSADGRYAAYLQDDANLVLCLTTNRTPDLSRPYWSVFANPASGQVRSQPSGPPYHAVMQSDGNFVLYDGRDPGHSGPPYWATNTSRSQGQFTAVMQTDGNFVVYAGLQGSFGSPIWASNTYTGHGLGLSIASGNNQSIPCQADAAKNYYASFSPLTVKVTDSVLNPLSGAQVTWTVAPVGNSMLEQVEVVNDAGAGICPADWANQNNVGFHWTSSSGANGIASLSVTARSLPVPGNAEGPPGVSFTITATSGSASVTFNLNVAGVMG
jgi:hypothetical protein